MQVVDGREEVARLNLTAGHSAVLLDFLNHHCKAVSYVGNKI